MPASSPALSARIRPPWRSTMLRLEAAFLPTVDKVVEGARKVCPIGFREYLKVGIPVTLLTLVAGVVLMR